MWDIKSFYKVKKIGDLRISSNLKRLEGKINLREKKTYFELYIYWASSMGFIFYVFWMEEFIFKRAKYTRDKNKIK